MLLIVPLSTFPDLVFGILSLNKNLPLRENRILIASNRANLFPDDQGQLLLDFLFRSITAGFQDDEADGDLAAEFVGAVHHDGFDHLGVFQKDFLHLRGGEPVSRGVDDVVQPAHYLRGWFGWGFWVRKWIVMLGNL
jgi:hypothetical protein